MTKCSELHICIMVVMGRFSVKLKLNEHEIRSILPLGKISIISYTDKKVDCQAWKTDRDKAAPRSTEGLNGNYRIEIKNRNQNREQID